MPWDPAYVWRPEYGKGRGKGKQEKDPADKECARIAAIVGGVVLVVIVLGLYFDYESTLIVLQVVVSIVQGMITFILQALVKFGFWTKQQIDLGMTLSSATRCAPYMCMPNPKITSLVVDMFKAQTGAYDCAPIALTTVNSNFVTRNMDFLTNSPHATQLKCYESHDLNGDQRKTCFPTDELPPCKGAVSWKTIEEDLRDVLVELKNNHPTCQDNSQALAKKDHWLAAVGKKEDKQQNSVCNLDCAKSKTFHEIMKSVDGSGSKREAMKALVQEWFPTVPWADVLQEPTNYCKYTTLTTGSKVVNMKSGYCPDIVKQIQNQLGQVTSVIRKNRGRHPKEEAIVLEEPAPNAIKEK